MGIFAKAFQLSFTAVYYIVQYDISLKTKWYTVWHHPLQLRNKILGNGFTITNLYSKAKVNKTHNYSQTLENI